jgi:rubrerythrin
LGAAVEQFVPDETSRKNLIALLKLAYSAERAAGLAYRGHWQSVVDESERIRIKQIEDEEWHHRRLVGEMLASLGSQPSKQREVRSLILGRALGFLCHVMGWLAPMYGAGRLESRNIREYETAARLARDCGRNDFVEDLLMMAEVEWEHEYYFRSRVVLHSFGRRLNLWQSPPPKETIRETFAAEEHPELAGVLSRGRFVKRQRREM